MGYDPNEIIAAFSTFDNDNKGKVSADEMRRALTTMGDKMSEKEVDKFLEEAGGGSSIDYKSFVEKLTKKAVPMTFDDDDE